MKRDLDLIRSLLLEIEEKEDGSGQQVDVNGGDRSSREIVGHLFMLYEAGFIDARDASHMSARGILVRRVTWEGHEFLDSIRDPEIWKQTKASAGKVGGFTMDVLAQLAKGLIKKKLKKHTGIDVDL